MEGMAVHEAAWTRRRARRTLAFRIVAVMVVACVGGLLLEPAPAHAATFTVNSTIDRVDDNPSDGSCATGFLIPPADGGIGFVTECTLRAAVQEANAVDGPDGITVPAGTYTLTIPEYLYPR